MTGFENCVVLKPWGHEFQVYDDGRCSVWMLHINSGQGTSVHCHFGKRARFIPLVGTAIVRTNTDTHRLTYPQSVAVNRYEFHAVGNGGENELALLEIETPSDKCDLFRLRDSYGRGQGYESGPNIMRDNLGRFGYFTQSPNEPTEWHRGVGLWLSSHGLYLSKSGSQEVRSHRLHDTDCVCVTEAA